MNFVPYRDKIHQKTSAGAAGLGPVLTVTAPFSDLRDSERHALVASARILEYPAGAAILVEDGPPADGLWLVLDGSVELLHDGQVVLVLEAGECFGHPSLLTGLAPAYTVRPRGPVCCAFFPREAALDALGTPAGAAYVAATLRARLVHQGYAAHGARDVGTTPVSAIMAAPLFLDPDAPVGAVLDALDRPGASVVLLGDATHVVGMLTDADIRRAAAAGRLDLQTPAAHLAEEEPGLAAARPSGGRVVSVPVGQLAVEAAVDMLAHGVPAVAVLDGDRVVGALSAAELVGLDAQSPIALRHTILAAADEDGLVRSAGHLPRLFGLLQRAGVPPRDLGRVLSLHHDALVIRLTDLSIARHGSPAAVFGTPLAWAWLDLGSAARREFTLGSDQDNALAYADPPAGRAAEVDAYFARLGAEVNAGLVRCGLHADHNGVLASEPRWRMSKAKWIATFDECFVTPDESHLIRASVAFDFRSAAGGLALTAELTDRMRAARAHPDFMRLMARSASGFPVALNRRARLATGHFDEPPGRLDLKRGAIIPLVNLARFHALAAGVTISPTLDRLEAAASLGALDAATATALQEAFNLITSLRFSHHAAQVAAGMVPDNLIDPEELAPIARGDLTEALRTVRGAQRRIEVLGGGR